MDNLLKEVEVAVGYHAKSTISKLDILLGDDKLLELIVNNLETKYEYNTLRDNVQAIIDQKLSKYNDLTMESSQIELVSSEDVDYKINKAIIDILNQVENEFVRAELLRVGLAPKKMLRAKMFLKTEGNNNYEYAALIELFHLATLIQDDVIDIASKRRYTQTINDKYNDQTAILISDYLLVHIGYMIGKKGQQNQSEVEATSKKLQNFYSELIKDFLKSLLYSEKEVTQVNDNQSYNQYASNKTAKFFKVALISGMLANNSQVTIEELEQIGDFGHKFGLIFQKVDDLLDYKADITVSGKDSRDAENEVNNYVLINLDRYTITRIKQDLSQEAKELSNSKFGQQFEFEINYLIRRINE